MQQHVYDLHPIRTGTDTFANTTREIAEYIARTYKGGGEFIQAMDPEALAFEELDDPRNNIPDEGERALMEIWKGDLRLYNDRIKDRMESSKTSLRGGAGAMLTSCERPTDCIRGMATNPGRH